MDTKTSFMVQCAAGLWAPCAPPQIFFASDTPSSVPLSAFYSFSLSHFYNATESTWF